MAETQPCAPVATTDGRINLAEGLEQMLDLLLGNADARVLTAKQISYLTCSPLSFSAVTETVTSQPG